MSITVKSTQRLPFDVSTVCFGTSPLGDMPGTYGYSVGEERAEATIRAIFEQNPCFVDSSRNYGMGRSEERLGSVIQEMGGLPEHAILSTKVDRNMETNVLDAARVRESFEESLTALKLDRVNILHLHDPEYCVEIEDVTKPGGALDELFKIKEEGLADAIGLAMGNLDLMTRLLPDWEFDALISHNRYSLLNREADQMYNDANERGIAIFNAAPFAGGVLAKGSAVTQRITYQEGTEEGLAQVQAVEEVCARHGVPLGAAALQFSLRDPRITSTIIGVSKPERVASATEWAEFETSDAFWEEILALPYSTEDPEANREYSPD